MNRTTDLSRRSRRPTGLAPAVFAALSLLHAAAAAADVSYFIFGRVTAVHVATGDVVSDTTSSIPGLVAPDPEPGNPPAAPVALPGVTIEAYRADTDVLLGRGRANREGFYNLSYTAPEVNHPVRFRVFLDFADGGREFVGAVEETPAGAPVVVDNRLFSFNLEVPSDAAVRGGSAAFSADNQFLFMEVGDTDMDDIFDEQQDPGDSTKWGLTKPSHPLGPDFGFGGGLELYGLFGATSGARYYRINYSGPMSGSIADPLYKKNYVIVGSGIEVHRTLMGPQDVTIGPETLTGVYALDEFLAGQPIPGHPGRFYSSFWTESALRAIWTTGPPGVPDGAYTLSVEAWDQFGNPVPASTNPFATLNLRVVNKPPEANIHSIQYLDGTIVLNDAAPCQTVVLNRITSSTDDDSLQFQITARHETGFFRQYVLQAAFGHDTPSWTTGAVTTPITAADPPVVTPSPPPPGSVYQSCAYRFHLRVEPRITNGYHIIYIRDDNWYAAINVLSP